MFASRPESPYVTGGGENPPTLTERSIYMTSDSDLLRYDSIVRSSVGEYLRGKAHRLRNEKQDMIQECLLQLWRVAGRIDPGKNPAAYVRKICGRVCAAYDKRLRRDAIYSASSLDEDNDE